MVVKEDSNYTKEYYSNGDFTQQDTYENEIEPEQNPRLGSWMIEDKAA
jgi:hypothetical protein